MSKITVEQLLEAGLHFGHQTFRWNPNMRQYIFDSRDGIHVLDLTKTADKLKDALEAVGKIGASGGTILLVGTKRQASPIIAELAKEAGLPYVTQRWPGGLLTNFKTIKTRIDHLKKLRDRINNKDFGDFTKQEIGLLEKERQELEVAFGGVDTLSTIPNAIFVVDVVREKIAVAEAKKLGIPIIAMVDTNGDPTGIDYVIPANDDAKQGILLVTKAIVDELVNSRKNVAKETTKPKVTKKSEIETNKE